MVRAQEGDLCSILRRSRHHCGGVGGRGAGGSRRTGLGWNALGRELGLIEGLDRGLYRPGV
jgi:hypothetical protein